MALVSFTATACPRRGVGTAEVDAIGRSGHLAVEDDLSMIEAARVSGRGGGSDYHVKLATRMRSVSTHCSRPRSDIFIEAIALSYKSWDTCATSQIRDFLFYKNSILSSLSLII